MNADDLDAGVGLLETGALVTFEVVKEEIRSSTDKAEFGMCIEMAMTTDAEYDEPGDVAAWGAFGFIFLLAALSFEDARPRGLSLPEYEEKDRFRVWDLFEGLRYERGELHYHGDYIRGRRIKTSVVVRPDGTIRLETVGRGKAAARWVARLQGKKAVALVKDDDEYA